MTSKTPTKQSRAAAVPQQPEPLRIWPVKRPPADYIAGAITAICKLIVSRPDALEVRHTTNTAGTTTYFSLRGDPVDDSRLVGYKGCHVKALEFLIGKVGYEHGQALTFKLITSPERCTRFNTVRSAKKYDTEQCSHACELWLMLLGVEGSLQVRDASSNGDQAFNFDLSVADPDKAVSMTLGAPNGFTLVGSLGTLVRAAGYQGGVKLQLNLL